MLHTLEILRRKRDGGALSREDWHYLFSGLASGETADYQITALLMAIYFRGMSLEETIDLTQAMVQSGQVLDLSAIDGFKVDKHSTGGVGDKTTLVLAPLLAAYGLPVVKLAGRGLGHTGGTLDKLQSIPGLRVDRTQEEMIRQVQEIGLVIAGQSEQLVPADRILYALRDVTGTVESIPLVASSVMSKKIAGGADGIVLDVKMGSGGFCPTREMAEELASTMVAIGKQMGRRVMARITRMDQPLGNSVGNSLELLEAIRMLRGEGPEDLKQLVLTLARDLCRMAQPGISNQEATAKLGRLLDKGYALEKLQQLIEFQGGDPRFVEQPEKLPKANVKLAVTLLEDGWLHQIDAAAVGRIAMKLGAGRATKADMIDPRVGIVLWKKVGDQIHKGEPVATIHATSLAQAMQAKDELEKQFVVGAKVQRDSEMMLIDEKVYGENEYNE